MTGAAQERGAQAPFARALAFELRTLELVADSVAPVPSGWIIRTPTLPQVWNLNCLRLPEPVPPPTALALADQHLADLPYRHLVIGHGRIDQALVEAIQREGFSAECEVVMAIAPDLAAAAPGAGETGMAPIEMGEGAMLELMKRWVAEDRRIGSSETTAAQLIESSRREGRAWDERRFGFADVSGGMVAITKLRSDGRTAQVEDVYTVPEARGRGYGRALVSHAVRVAGRAGHELIFIVADDNDWPKHLYARVGFQPIGFHLAFHREAA